MKIKFLPKKSIDVQICDIYEDRDAVIIQHTDTLLSNTAYNVEALGFKFGIKPCAFHWPYGGLQSSLTDINRTGVLKFGVYIPTDRYRGETTSGYLPDYAASALTADGASYYGRPFGTSKASGTPNQGQELFNFTNGVKGYDVLNGVPGTENNLDFIREMNYIDEWYLDKFGRKPSSGADRQGKIGSKEVYLPYYLGIRGTEPLTTIDNHLYSGIDRLDFIHKRITSRWENGFSKPNMDAENTILIDSINTAFSVNGMFNDFVHWHRAITFANDIYKLHDLYELIYNTVDGRNAWYTGYSEAVEYYWFKTMVKRVRGSIVDGKLFLIADFDDEYFNQKIAGIDSKLLYNRIKQALSVKIDLSGTELAGKDLKGADMISLGNNQYIVDIPFTIEDNYLQAVCLEESDETNYKNFTIPSIESNSGGVMTTNIPTRAVLFDKDFNETMTVLKRSNELSTIHNLSGLSGTKIGLVSKWGVSSLIEI